MKNLFFLAQDGNADQLFAEIDSMTDLTPTLIQIKLQYENAEIEDQEFCDKVLEYLKPPSHLRKFVVVMCNQECWDEPHIFIVDAADEEEAQLKAEEAGGFEEGEVDELLEDGSIYVEVKEVGK